MGVFLGLKEWLKAKAKYVLVPCFLVLTITLFLGLSFGRQYVIYCTSVDDVFTVRNNLSGRYQVRNETIWFEDEWTPIGTKDDPFQGVFDGGGVTVVGVNYALVKEGDKLPYFGFFGYNCGTIKNVNFYVYGALSNMKFENLDFNEFAGSFFCAYNYGK